MAKISFKLLFLFTAIMIFGQVCHAQNGVWTWLHGTDSSTSLGNYGVKGMPADSNMPGGYYEGAYWTDKQGDFWLFGGSYQLGYTNHMWKYNPLTNQWTWMNGPKGIADQNGEWGVQGVSSPLNYPSARTFGPNCWTDNNGDLWLFGGYGFDVNGDQGGLSDLWKYTVSTNEWTWVNGSNLKEIAPIYGVMGVASPQNNPGARLEFKSGWVDDNNNLWMFGGQDGASGAVTMNLRNDMWRYNIGTNEWTWMNGTNALNGTGSYGIMGLETAANLPSARMPYTQWIGLDGNFYIFGGGRASISLNDVWKYNLQTNNWTWVSGTNLLDDNGIYSTKCNPNNIDLPHARMENSTIGFGANKSHLLWSFGGFEKVNLTNSYNDLWIYNMNNNNWTWVSGYDYTVLNTTGEYGIKGVASPANVIPARAGACIWKDINNNLYFFGGLAADSTLPAPPGHPFALGLKNDLWRFTPDTSCFWEPALNTNVHDASKENSLKIYPNPTDGKFTLSSDVKLNNAMLIIRNNIGQEIYQLPNLKGKSFNLDITTYPSGIYFVQLIEKNYHAYFKIVKQ